jgi:hypothetical protein
MNPASASRNAHHTMSGWRSEQEFYEDYQRDRAEAEYFAHEEPITHNYPRTRNTDTIVCNELILGESPF